jgi:hypothetical protein
MNGQIVSQDDGRWRPPSNVREGVATVVALALVFGFIQVAAPFVQKAEFIAKEIRDYAVGVGFALFVPVYRVINQGLQAAQGGSGLIRPELSPWFVTGVTAAALLFAWNQFVGFVSGAAIAAAIRSVGQSADLSQVDVGAAVTLGATFIVMPLCAVASIVAGIGLNRTTRSGVLLALILASVAYLGLSVLTAWIIQPDSLQAALREAMDQQQALAFVAALAIIAILVFVFGGLGVIISRLQRERSIGRLTNAARRLEPADRDAITQDVLDRLQQRG